MLNKGWIKLYRKIVDKGILKDHAAWAVFTWLLLMVDRETGKRTIGRYQISDEVGIKPNTFYKILHRLEKKWGAISLTSQKVYTEVCIVNWAKYQYFKEEQSNDSQMTVKSSSNESNTKQEVRIKNKEYKLREKEKEKIPNRISLNKSQYMIILKKYPALNLAELREQVRECNFHIIMSSYNYKNPGLFFWGWLKKYIEDKKLKKQQEEYSEGMLSSLPIISEEERQRNLQKLKKIKENLKLKLAIN